MNDGELVQAVLNETVKFTQAGEILNRLSKLQRMILVMAYHHYASDPRLPHTDVNRSDFPELSLAEMRAGVRHDPNAPKFDIPHAYTSEIIAGAYLGLCYARRVAKVSEASSPSRHAAVARSLQRLESRGLASRMMRWYYPSGIRLTPKGIVVAQNMTGIVAMPRSWEPTLPTSVRAGG